MNGKQFRVKQSSTVDGISVDQFIEENADSIWLHHNELWELIPVEEPISDPAPASGSVTIKHANGIPF